MCLVAALRCGFRIMQPQEHDSMNGMTLDQPCLALGRHHSSIVWVLILARFRKPLTAKGN